MPFLRRSFFFNFQNQYCLLFESSIHSKASQYVSELHRRNAQRTTFRYYNYAFPSRSDQKDPLNGYTGRWVRNFQSYNDLAPEKKQPAGKIRN